MRGRPLANDHPKEEEEELGIPVVAGKLTFCSSQPSMVHWLSSPIFPCRRRRPAMVTSVQISLLVAPHPKTPTETSGIISHLFIKVIYQSQGQDAKFADQDPVLLCQRDWPRQLHPRQQRRVLPQKGTLQSAGTW